MIKREIKDRFIVCLLGMFILVFPKNMFKHMIVHRN